MKQTVEQAANEYMETLPVKAAIKCGDIEDLESHIKVAFKTGYEWQSKQSPWISVEDKDGCDTSDDCIVMTEHFEIFKSYFSSKNEWIKCNNGYYDEMIEDVICWMPIPSFDDILEANKDVLKRIKEKGD